MQAEISQIDTLARLLQVGLGRALLYVNQHYDTSYRDVIIKACLHNLAYDPQVEGSRATYMFDVIAATPDFAFCRSTILNALTNLTDETDEYDVHQIYDLAAHAADHGDSEARETIYRKFRSDPALGDFAGALEIIALDGLDGFVFVAELLSDHIRTHGPVFSVGEYRYEVDDSLRFELEDQLGITEASAALEQLRSSKPNIIPVLNAIEHQPLTRQHETARQSYRAVKQLIARAENGPYFYRKWARKATENELLLAASDLLLATDSEQQRRYLAIFSDRVFPLNSVPLFELVKSQDKSLAISAIRVLRKINDPAVRVFALGCLEQDYMVGQIAALLKGDSFQENDWLLLESLTTRALESEDYHALEHSILDIFDAHPTPRAVQSFLNLYEYGHCSRCRKRVIERLDSLHAIPRWMHEEGLYDSNLDIREMMKDRFEDA